MIKFGPWVYSDDLNYFIIERRLLNSGVFDCYGNRRMFVYFTMDGLENTEFWFSSYFHEFKKISGNKILNALMEADLRLIEDGYELEDPFIFPKELLEC